MHTPLITQIIQDKFLNVFHALFNYDRIKYKSPKENYLYKTFK